MSNTMLTLKELFDKHQKLDKNEVILDVRRAEEYQDGHMPGAKNISHEQVLDHVNELKKYKAVYIHCKRGGRAKTAFEALKGAGLENLVCIHDAGMDAWIENGYPVQK